MGDGRSACSNLNRRYSSVPPCQQPWDSSCRTYLADVVLPNMSYSDLTACGQPEEVLYNLKDGKIYRKGDVHGSKRNGPRGSVACRSEATQSRHLSSAKVEDRYSRDARHESPLDLEGVSEPPVHANIFRRIPSSTPGRH